LDEEASRISNKKLPLIERKSNFAANILDELEEVLNIYDAFEQRQPRPIFTRYLLLENIDEIVSNNKRTITLVQS
jgi:hypothetical protein